MSAEPFTCWVDRSGPVPVVYWAKGPRSIRHTDSGPAPGTAPEQMEAWIASQFASLARLGYRQVPHPETVK